jgi:hypothetical protein
MSIRREFEFHFTFSISDRMLMLFIRRFGYKQLSRRAICQWQAVNRPAENAIDTAWVRLEHTAD